MAADSVAGPCCGSGWVAGKESPHQKKFQPTKLALDSSGVVCFKIVFMNCHCFGVAVFDLLRLKKKLFVFVFGSRLYCILFFPGWY